MPEVTRKCFAITKTIFFYLLFITMGSIVAVPGPTLMALQESMKENADLSLAFTFRSLGYIVGAILGGLLLSYVSQKDLVLTLESTAMAFLVIGLPFSDYVWKFYVIIFFLGMATQSLNAGANVCVLNLWGRQAASYFLALHFSFGVGGLLAPLIARPFLSSTTGAQYPPQVAYAYIIIACNTLVITLCFFLFNICTAKKTASFRTHSVASDIAIEASIPQPEPRITYLTLTLISIALFFGFSIEVSYSQCVSTFAEKGFFNMTNQQGSDMAATFWGTYMASRFVAIFVSTRIDISIIILTSFITLLAAGVILVSLGFIYAPAVWVGSALVGFGVGPLFPATITWVSKYIEVTFMIGSMFFAISSVAEMSVPYFLLSHVDKQPKGLNLYILSAAIFGSIFYFLVWLIFSRIKDRYHRATNNQAATENTENAPDNTAEVVSLNGELEHLENRLIESAHFEPTST